MKAVSYNLKTDRNIGTLGKETLPFFNAFSSLVEYFLSNSTSYNRTSSNTIDLRLEMSCSQSVTRALEDEKLAELFYELKASYLESIKNVHKKGKEEGSNILFMLQTGELSIKQLNEKA
jgi:hypothetical protein